MRYFKILLILSAVFILISPSAKNFSSTAQSTSVIVNNDTCPIIVYGDTRNGHEVHKKIISRIIKEKPCAVFHTGDLVFDGRNRRNWEVFNSIVNDLVKTVPLYPVRGNHERGVLKINQPHVLPGNTKWYSLDIRDIHFVVLDVCDKYTAGSEQYEWLVNDLKNQPAATRFTVVMMHYPMYSSGPHRTQIKKLRSTFVPLFKQYGVDVVFSAHNHGYERSYSEGVYYIVTAGGGAPLYNRISYESWSQVFVKDYHYCVLNARNDTLFITAKDTAGKVIDRFFMVP